MSEEIWLEFSLSFGDKVYKSKIQITEELDLELAKYVVGRSIYNAWREHYDEN